MYEAQKPSEWGYVLEDSTPSILFVSKPEIAEKANNGDWNPLSVPVVCFGDDSMQRFLGLGAGKPLPDSYPVCGPHDLATIIYTSGTSMRHPVIRRRVRRGLGLRPA